MVIQFISEKPLSVNEAWKGKRFKTDKYKNYEYKLLYLLPQIVLPPPPFEIYLVFGFSNIASDFDNPTKLLIDIMQKKYNFNDKHIYRAVIEKKIVKRGQEYFGFKITHYEHS